VPVVRSVRSPGVNLMLSQTSPKSIGVKRASSTPSQTPSKFPFLFFPLTVICSELWIVQIILLFLLKFDYANVLA
jgi:hypothetical protein